jgi:hypothetical protein
LPRPDALHGIAVLFEERDLVDHFGDAYREYQRRVPMFIPNLGGGRESPAEVAITPASLAPETLAR